MAYHKFGPNDIFNNVIEAHPKCEFFIHRRTIYYNGEKPQLGTINPNKNVKQIPSGYLSLYELNIDRLEADYIYPFVTKDGNATPLKTVSAKQFQQFGYGDIITGSYPDSASISIDRYDSTVTSRPRLRALRNTLDYYKPLSPSYAFGNKLTEDLTLISIPSIFYGSSIDKGTVSMQFYYDGELVAELKDEKQNGELIQTYPSAESADQQLKILITTTSGAPDPNFGQFIPLLVPNGIKLSNYQYIFVSTTPQNFVDDALSQSSVEVYTDGTLNIAMENLVAAINNEDGLGIGEGNSRYGYGENTEDVGSVVATWNSATNELEVVRVDDLGESNVICFSVRASGVDGDGNAWNFTGEPNGTGAPVSFPNPFDAAVNLSYDSCTGLLQPGINKTAGIILYNEGFIILNPDWELSGSGYGTNEDYYNATLNESTGDCDYTPDVPASWLYWGALGCEDDNENIEETIPRSSWGLSFNGTSYVPTVTMLAHAKKGELNHSNNPTYLTFGQNNANIEYEKSVVYAENADLSIANVTYSPYEDPDEPFEKTTWISKIGIYDENKNLIAIATLANPIKKTEDRDFTFKLKLDI